MAVHARVGCEPYRSDPGGMRGGRSRTTPPPEHAMTNEKKMEAPFALQVNSGKGPFSSGNVYTADDEYLCECKDMAIADAIVRAINAHYAPTPAAPGDYAALKACYDGLLDAGNKLLAERDALREQ